MKERQIKSQKIPNLGVQILDGEFALLWDDEEEDRFTDNADYAYEILRLLKQADELGAFNHIKKDPEEGNIDKTYI